MRNLDTEGKNRVFLLKKLGLSEEEVMADPLLGNYPPEQLSFLYKSLVLPHKITLLMLGSIIIYCLYIVCVLLSLNLFSNYYFHLSFPALPIVIMPFLISATAYLLFRRPVLGHASLVLQILIVCSQFLWFMDDVSMEKLCMAIGLGTLTFILSLLSLRYALKEGIDPFQSGLN